MDEAARSAPPAEGPAGAPRPVRRLTVWVARPLRWCWAGLKRIAQFLLIAWATLAIRYSNLPWAWSRVVLALAFAGFAVWALWVSRRARARWAFAGAFAAVAVWFAC